MIARITAALLVLAGHMPHMQRPGYIEDLSVAYADAALLTGQPPMLLVSLGWHESRFLRRARSSVGATGLMQVLPSAWPSLPLGSLWDDVYAGAYVLSHYQRRCGGSAAHWISGYRAGGRCIPPRDVDLDVVRTWKRIRELPESCAEAVGELVEVKR